MKNIAISIVMPVYNNASTLRRALDSVLAQDFEEGFELICAIDPCADGSYEILKEYESAHPETIVILAPKERLGTALSRQKAIEMARGEYVYFIDGDDALRKDCLSVLYRAIKRKNADVVNCAFYVVYGKKNKKFIYPFRRNATLNKKAALNSFYMDACIRGFMWTKLYRKEILLSMPRVILASTKDMFEDQALNATLLAKCDKVILLAKPLYYYYKNVSTSLSTVKRTDRAMRHIGVFAVQRTFYEKTGDQIALKVFKKHLYRAKWSVNFDLRIDKKHGCSKDYIARVKQAWKDLKNLKKPLPIEGRDYEELLNRCFIS